RRSSIQETAASPAIATAATRLTGANTPAAQSTIQAAAIAVTTAMPPPRGTGLTCEERALGMSSTVARRNSAINTRAPRHDARKTTMVTVSFRTGSLIARETKISDELASPGLNPGVHE